MLNKLIIKNVALIEHTEIDFKKGLNVLSGETGSGKSVIIDSLNFVLGAKADKTMISYGKDFSLVQAEFDIINNKIVKEILEELGAFDEEVLIISRKLSIDGRSEIKVNGNTFTSSMLKKVTSLLVDIHGQSEHFSLLKETNQLGLIDKYCGEELLAVKQNITDNYYKLKQINDKLNEFGGDESSRAIKLDILSYQINEIEKADIKENEEEELTLIKNKLSNQEKIIYNLNLSYQYLEEENGAKDSVSNALHSISQLSEYSDQYQELANRLENLNFELEDIVEHLSNEKDGFEVEPDKLDEINERLELIKNIYKKYGGSFNELQNFLIKAKEDFNKINNYSELTEKLNSEKQKIQNELYKNYKQLSETRKKYSLDFAERITKELYELGMGKAKFEVSFSDFPKKEDVDYNLAGQDKIEYLFSANLGQPLKPLAKIISGGEISRFMLALKTVTAKLQEIDTFVFDEIDAGISGKIAEIVAKKFAKIALNTEVIAISHLPQIASMSDKSFLIYKEESEGNTKSYIKPLNENDKIFEVTRLVGGDINDDIAIKHASSMISKSNEYKNTLKKL